MRGQSIVELLIAIALSSIFLPALLTALVASREGKPQQKQRIEAVSLLKEAEEIIRSVREKGWTTFAINGTYHPEISGNSWELVEGPETINSLTRAIDISDAYREENGAIVETDGTLDPSTKKVVITISWNTPFPTSVSSTIYLTRYFGNSSFEQTTEADFLAGLANSVTITNSSGGEVILASGGKGDWCKPSLSINPLDLPKQGVALALTAIEDEAFAGTGENASGVSLADINITNTDPPQASIIGTYDGYKTNDVFGENNYFYLTTDTNNSEVAIIDISTTPFSQIGSFDSPGSTDGESIFVAGNIGYMTAGNMFYNFDLSGKVGSRPAVDADGITLAGTGTSIYIVGNYAYVSVAGSATKMQLVDISNPSNLTIVGQTSVDGQDGQDVFVNSSGTRAYLVADGSPSQNELFIIDTSTKTGDLPLISSYDSQGMSPKGVVIVPGNKAIIVGTGAEEYQVIDTISETALTRCGGLEINTGVNDVATVLESDGEAYAYLVTGDTNSEFKIIEGGPGGQYATSGDFESATFDPGFEAAFNRFDVTFIKPVQTDIKFQIAAADAVSGSCSGASFTFVGPDGTSGSYFSDGDEIPLSDDGTGFENPGRCFGYKVYFSTSDIANTPVFYDLKVNYSP